MRKLFCLFVVLVVSTASAQAREDQLEASSGASNFVLQDTTFFYGPVISDPSSKMGDSTWIGRPAGMSLQNQIGLRYDFNETFSLTPTLDFEVLMNDPNEIYKEDQILALSYDSFIRASAVGLLPGKIGPHDFWLNADVRLFVPTSEYSRQNGTLGGVRLTLAPSVQFDHSNFSLSFVNFVRFWAQTRGTDKNDSTQSLPRTMFYTGPLVSYQVNDNFAIWGLVEASVIYNTAGAPNTRDPRRSLVDFEPGIDIKISDHVTLSPYINWFTNQELNTASMNLMATISM